MRQILKRFDISVWSEKNDCKGQNEFIEESMPKIIPQSNIHTPPTVTSIQSRMVSVSTAGPYQQKKSIFFCRTNSPMKRTCWLTGRWTMFRRIPQPLQTPAPMRPTGLSTLSPTRTPTTAKTALYRGHRTTPQAGQCQGTDC